MSSPLRILMVAPTSFFSDYGGHIRILEEAYALQDLGQRVAIVTYYKGSDMPGLDIRRTPPLPYHTDYEVGSSRHKIAFDAFLLAQTLLEGLRYKPDIIHGHMHEGALIGGLLAKLLRVPLVFDFQGSLTEEMVDHAFLNPNGRFFSIVRSLEKFITCRLPSAILTSSLRAHDFLQAQFGVPSERLHALPDCANPSRFDPDKFSDGEKKRLRRNLGIPDGRLIVAYLGLLTDYQGIPHLVETAVRCQAAGENLHFLVMGYPDVDHYRRLAQKKGVNNIMTFTGKVEYRDAPYYLSLGDIAVAPKISTTEGSGKLLNYMSLAQPIVAYDSAVHREYLGDLGVYAPMGDVDQFAQSIQELAHDPQRRQELGQQLRQRALQEYSWRRAGEVILALYRDLTR